MKKNFIGLFVFLFFIDLYSQEINISYRGSSNYILVERTNLLRYDNKKYIGLVSREIRSFISSVSFNSDYLYEGNFFVQQDTRRASDYIGTGIHESIPSKFRISDDGSFTMMIDNGYPSFRSFPTYPEQKLKIGDSWTAKAERSVDPLNRGIPTKMPIYVQYQLTDDSQKFHDEDVYLITAKWATRYGMGSGTSYIDYSGDGELLKATGSHKASIFVSKRTGATLVINDSVDETFFYADGNQIQLKGTISMFTEYPPSVERSILIPTIQRIAGLSQKDAEKLSKKSDFSTNPSTLQISKNNTQKSVLNEDFSTGQNTLKDSKNKSKKSVLSEDTKNYENITEALLTVDETPAGLRLTIPDLKFIPDSDQLLPGEEERLNQIYEILKLAPDSLFLVEGHTAQTGNSAGELELSVKRSKAVAEALIKRGINSGKFICKGSGSSKPIADNNTAEGKSKNRRVEITILE